MYQFLAGELAHRQNEVGPLGASKYESERRRRRFFFAMRVIHQYGVHFTARALDPALRRRLKFEVHKTLNVGFMNCWNFINIESRRIARNREPERRAARVHFARESREVDPDRGRQRGRQNALLPFIQFARAFEVVPTEMMDRDRRLQQPLQHMRPVVGDAHPERFPDFVAFEKTLFVKQREPLFKLFVEDLIIKLFGGDRHAICACAPIMRASSPKRQFPSQTRQNLPRR